MKPLAFLIWTVPYGASLLFAVGLPSSVWEWIGFAVGCGIAGFYGLFVRDVTEKAIRVHPIQTTLSVCCVTAIILPPVTLFVFSLANISMLLDYEGDSYSWIFVSFLLGLLLLVPLLGASAGISLLLCRSLSKHPERK